MKDLDSDKKVSESLHLLRRFAGMKGGRKKVKKGFAKNIELASKSGKKGMNSRWHSEDEQLQK